MSLTVTAAFIAIFALIQIPMTLAVGAVRFKSGVQFMDGGDQDLLRRMRSHANFTESVPITMLAMAAAEITGSSEQFLCIVGSIFLAGRLGHYASVRLRGWTRIRPFSMLATLGGMGAFAIATLVNIAG